MAELPAGGIDGAYRHATTLMRDGRIEEAEVLCERILSAHPEHAETLTLRGVIELQSGRAERASESLRRSIQLRPEHALANALLADALLDLGRPAEALRHYEAALRFDANIAPVHLGRANALLDLGRPEESLVSFDAALALDAELAEAHFNRGNALLALRRHAEAVESFGRAIVLRPEHAAAHHNRGSALLFLRRPEQALTDFENAIGLDAADPDAWLNSGFALLQLGRAGEALGSFDHILARHPNHFAALCGRGDALLELHEPARAFAAYDEALRLQPGSSDALNGRGNCLQALHRLAEAVACYDGALQLDPDNALVHFNRARALLAGGTELAAARAGFEQTLRLRPDYAPASEMLGRTLLALGQPEVAVRRFEDLLSLEPEFPWAPGALLNAQLRCADWTARMPSAGREAVVRAVTDGRPADLPFSFLSVSDSAAAQRRCAETYLARRCTPTAPLWRGTHYRHDRLRIAYVSADFREHAVSYLLADPLTAHDRDGFEITGISLRPEEPSPMGRRIKQAFDQFVDASALADRDVAELLLGLEIDVAVDLGGFTDGARPMIFAHRGAPIQVSYLGFPATMGAGFIDYLLADSFVIPPDRRHRYREQIVDLPGCFQAGGARPEAAPVTRGAVGLPEDAFVFGCLNSTHKLNRALFEIWMRLLARTPGSVLWLLSDATATRDNLLREAVDCGIDPQRLVFSARRPYAEYVGALRLADLYLDTLPFNGGTTASDALWSGVPLLTCPGDAFAARMAGSMLNSLGLPELIARDLQDYESKAIALARGPEELGRLRGRLHAARASAGLFDAGRSRSHLEAAFAHMVRLSEDGAPPSGFSVPQAGPGR